MVWIHGGGYGIGSAAAFDFSYMNKVFGNKFIFVTIQYRLGAFGFLSSETVFKHGVLNVGLHDQRLALTWVQDHIHKFGGDAAQVTIAGESAGAGSVIHAAIANGGSDGDSLWRRGIMSSPYLPAQWMYNDSKPSEMYRKFAEIAGCLTSGMDLGETPDTSIFECLQNTDTVTLQAASAITSQQTTYGQWGFAPVIDLTLIRDQAMHLLRKGQVNGEKMLVGHNANEGTYFTFGPLKFPFPISLQPNFFVPQNITTEEQFVDFIRYYYRALSNQDVATILSLYAPDSRISAKSPKFASNGLTPPFSTDVSNFAVGWQQVANNLYAEAMFVCPAYWIADAYSSMLEINITSSRWAKLVPQLSWLYESVEQIHCERQSNSVTGGSRWTFESCKRRVLDEMGRTLPTGSLQMLINWKVAGGKDALCGVI
ncbi:hypothetical protein NW754_000320 [Fusarium falciforme]|nr:hypothetical protein NW754_000320 [Fusarium falciforme]